MKFIVFLAFLTFIVGFVVASELQDETSSEEARRIKVEKIANDELEALKVILAQNSDFETSYAKMLMNLAEHKKQYEDVLNYKLPGLSGFPPV